MKIRDTMTGKTIGIMMLLTALLCYGFRNSQPQAYETIHEAAEKGSLEDVKRHLKQGVDVNAKDKDGYTPLHRAAVSGFKDVAELLKKHGARE